MSSPSFPVTAEGFGIAESPLPRVTVYFSPFSSGYSGVILSLVPSASTVAGISCSESDIITFPSTVSVSIGFENSNSKLWLTLMSFLVSGVMLCIVKSFPHFTT